MEKLIAFVRLDLLSVKPYLTAKNMLLFLGIAVIIVLSSGTPASAIALLMMYGSLYTTYPFATGDNDGIDALYATLSVKRSTVVFGRYSFAFITNLASGLFALVVSFLLATVLRRSFDFQEALAIALGAFVGFSLIQAIQYPVYFRLGYMKATFYTYLPYVTFALLGAGVNVLVKNEHTLDRLKGIVQWMDANSVITAIMAVCIWLALILISCRLSLRYYKQRDF